MCENSSTVCPNISAIPPAPPSTLTDSTYVLLSLIDTFIKASVIPILCLFGIGGNLINVVVLNHHGFKDTTSWLLLSLSAADLMFSVVHLVLQLKYIVDFYDPVLGVKIMTYSYVCLSVLYRILIPVNVCHVTAIAAERVVAVCFPFHVARIFTLRNVKIGIASFYLIPLGMFSPFFFVFEPRWVYSPQLKAVVPMVFPTPFYLTCRRTLSDYSYYVLINIFGNIVPATLLICSIVIGVTMNRRSILKSATMSMKDKKEKKTLKMLVTVCVVALFICLPALVIDMISLYSGLTAGILDALLTSLEKTLCQIHCCSNFIIYATLSSKFSRIYLKLFCRYRQKVKE